ncbi:M1 family metallopeptidase [Salegentibacter mishustinae]|uniref:Peptidase M1 n=1 Tax=Salegentibacter mishustinae TaxID=270918 RepID=A0A0Q9ZJP2_9FLAO|nr:M1 family metallopeptidase [Salegentibacter mishustinae]KRG29882.1 peptidase M1 [Salegentibacter mishustinae]PNW20708.1 peptidase M1 [Salegentibacter mishustinae]PZX61724.1 peptidase M1-like protein [Salegentibacter mishustinae]GGW98124.1 peptidase M1 [Salegentibacter mishustinae]
MKKLLLSLALVATSLASAQNNTSYWQQHVDYKMEVDMNVDNFQYTGSQELVYTNNSPDTLDRVFYHLYFNAFQPGSEMDVRSLTIKDPDRRVGDHISKLTEEEQGYLRVSSLDQNGNELSYEEVGTVLEVELEEPILPGEKATFNMEFEGQVPEQIRRSGRNSSEGVALSMSQWFPKMAEYDFEGWHAAPYIGREFHGVWGDFDVKLTIDKDYTVAASGYLQNPEEIGHGYSVEEVQAEGDTHTWHFVAPKVHDFTWAADPEYIHDKRTAEDGTVLHFFYKDNDEIKENWKNLQEKTEELLLFFNENIGPYPWDQYTVAQGGDGGMEYAMLTLITGERNFGSLVGVTAHELAHAWFQHLMATNESKHEWMDEGFTSYISSAAMNQVMETYAENPHTGSYRGYMQLANSGVEQPQTTQADRYNLNAAYGAAAYSKGAVFLAQLGYIIGKDNLDKTLKRYYDEWKFKHPTPNNFIRVAEKVSGAELDWYLNDWTRTTAKIDYGIKEVTEVDENSTKVTLESHNLMPMPIDITVRYSNGEEEMIYIPLQMMRWEKPAEHENWTVAKDWAWAYPTYELNIDKPLSEIESIEIDESQLMADVKRDNNLYTAEEPSEEEGQE